MHKRGHKEDDEVDCRIVFYAARKTSFCERALQKSFSELGIVLADTSFATNSQNLGNLLIDAFNKCDVVFIIGGLGFSDHRSISGIISHAVADANIDECKKLKNECGEDGYVLKAQNQLLILLPDEPHQIEMIMQGPIRGYIKIKNKARV